MYENFYYESINPINHPLLESGKFEFKFFGHAEDKIKLTDWAQFAIIFINTNFKKKTHKYILYSEGRIY